MGVFDKAAFDNVKKYVEYNIETYRKLLEKSPNHPYYLDVLDRLIKLKGVLERVEGAPSVDELRKAVEIARGFQVIPWVLNNIIKRLEDRSVSAS